MPGRVRPVFPIELLGEVLGHVAALSSDSRATLLACSLVNWVMYFLSRELIFNEATIDYSLMVSYDYPDTNKIFSILDSANGHCRGPRFYEVLRASRHICTCVRTLKIRLSSGRSINPNRHTFSLERILPLLPRLQTLVFCRMDGSFSDEYREMVFDPRTFASLRKSLFALPPTVSHLDVRGFAIFPLSLVLQSPVRLNKITFTKLDDALPTGPFYGCLKPTSLGMGTCPPLSRQGFDVSLVRNLKISTQAEFLVLQGSVKSVVDACRDTLECLEISTEWYKRNNPSKLPVYTDQLEGLAKCLDLGNHTALRCIKITVIFSWLNVDLRHDEGEVRRRQLASFASLAKGLLSQTPGVASVILSIHIDLTARTSDINSISQYPDAFIIPSIDLASLFSDLAVDKAFRADLCEIKDCRTPHESVIPLDSSWTSLFVWEQTRGQ